MSNSEYVIIPKTSIKEGLIAKIEDTKKGSTGFYVVLGALANEDTKAVMTTYKELEKLTGFSRATITKMLHNFCDMGLMEKFSVRGSRKTYLKLV